MDAEFDNPGGAVAEIGPPGNRRPKSASLFKALLIGGWLAAIVAVFAILTVFIPVSFVTKLIFTENINFQDIEGSIWQGEAEAYYQYDRVGAVSWDMDVPSLLGGNIQLACTLENSILSLQGICDYEFDYIQFSMKGTSTTEFINTYTKDYDVSFPGILEIRSMDASRNDRYEIWVDRASVEWDGGLVDLSAFDLEPDTYLGPAYANLTREGDSATIVVTPVGESDRIMTIRLDLLSGSAHITIYQKLLSYVNAPLLRRSITWIRNLGEDSIHEMTLEVF